MRKYLAVAAILFKAQITYRFDVILNALGTIWRVVFAWIMWGAIFAGKESVGGFTLQTMLSYYVINAMVAALNMSDGVSGEVSARIREGSFSKFMVIPTNPLVHFTAQTFGATGYYGLFSLLAAASSALVFGIRPVFTTDPVSILLAVLMLLLGLVFMNCYQFFVGIWAFKFHDIGFMLHILPSIVQFFRGEYVPLALLPEALSAMFKLLPFAHAAYTPTMLLMGEAGRAEGLYGLSVLMGWTVFMATASQITYHRLRTKYEGVGI